MVEKMLGKIKVEIAVEMKLFSKNNEMMKNSLFRSIIKRF